MAATRSDLQGAGLSSRGHDRERQVRRLLEDDDWFVCRSAGSLGDVDLVALKDGKMPRLIEVKSTAGGPYERFTPKERADLIFAAKLAGADAWLVWWPPRGTIRWIHHTEWPVQRRAPRLKAVA